MPRSLAAFPRLMRVAAEAGRFAYGNVPVVLSGNALVQAMSGRRSVQASPTIGDHPHRMGQALAHLLRDPAARRDLRELLDSYED